MGPVQEHKSPFLNHEYVELPIHTPAVLHQKQASNIHKNVGVRVSKSVRHFNCWSSSINILYVQNKQETKSKKNGLEVY